MQNEWRRRNAHNETFIGRPFDFNKVTVGRRTYGIINAYTWGEKEEHLYIGHYVSIADDVVFLLGGNHHHTGVTTFPCRVKLMGAQEEALTKGPIEIGSDVWLGYRTTVLSGVTIGQGAVIGAGSVICKDVPAYSIAAGNPIKVIGWRFDFDVIKEMVKLDWGKVTDEALKESYKLLYKDLTKDNVREVIDSLEGR